MTTTYTPAIADRPIHSVGDLYELVGTLALSGSYAAGGDALAFDAILKEIGAGEVFDVRVGSELGYHFEYDYTNKKLKVYSSFGDQSTMLLTDLDAAAATGLALYVHIDEVLESGSYIGHLESITAGDADSTFELFAGGPIVKVLDDDAAATLGDALYFDEDATLGARLLADTTHVVYIMASNGEFIEITPDADPGTPGVLLYFDDDAANKHERLLFVSPTDASGTEITSAVVSMNERAVGELVAGAYPTALAAAVPRITVLGR